MGRGAAWGAKAGSVRSKPAFPIAMPVRFWTQEQHGIMRMGNLSLSLLVMGCLLAPASTEEITVVAASGPGDPGSGHGPQGELVIFHAGSLTAPMADLLHEFVRLHPGVEPQPESSGSLDAARKITELGKSCDILAVADYEVIPSLLVPQYANWYALFARNQMVLMYTEKSKFAGEINSNNWHEISLRPGVQVGHSDPNADPGGYRTLLVWQLAEKYYQRPGLYRQLDRTVPAKNIRPKSVELVALLQSGELDYIYGYRSVAEQDKLPFVTFPPEIDLSDISKADLYASVAVEVAGKKPGQTIKIKGLPIIFGLTIPRGAPHARLAEAFIKFMFSSEGRRIMQRNYLLLIWPPLASDMGELPSGLRDDFVPLGKGDASSKR